MRSEQARQGLGQVLGVALSAQALAEGKEYLDTNLINFVFQLGFFLLHIQRP